MRYEVIVGPRQLKVIPAIGEDLYDRITQVTSYMLSGYQHTTTYKLQKWDGKVSLFRNNRAPSGLYLSIASIIVSAGHEVGIKFEKDYTPVGKLFVHSLQLMDFQEQAARRAIKYRYCTIAAPIRSGKTAIIGAIINRLSLLPVCIITTGKDLVKQTCREIEKFTGKAVGVFSESIFAPADIIVTSYNALAALAGELCPVRQSSSLKEMKKGYVSEKIMNRNIKIVEYLNQVKVLFLDECQLSFGKQLHDALNRFSSIGYRISLSGTPIPDSKHYVQATACNGPVVTNVPYDVLIAKNRLAVPKVILYDLPANWFEHAGYLDAFGQYEVGIVNNVRRNQLIIQCVEALHRAGKSCFVMAYWLQHAKILRQMINNSFLVWGHTETSTRFAMYESVQDKNLKCVISTVGKIGLNLPRLDAVINAEGRASNTLTIQKMRSLTACDGKKYGIVVDFIDKGPLSKASMRRLQHYSKIGGAVLETRKIPEGWHG